MRKVKPKKCANCEKEFTPFKTTDQWCSLQCSIEFNSPKNIEKRYKAMKKNVTKKSIYNTLQDLINNIVRLIDRGHDCITSGAKYGHYTVNAGHYFSVGSNPTLRYNLLNIFNQSENDNANKGGRGSNYSLRLKEIFGSDVRDEIEGLVAKYPYLGLTQLEAKQKCAIAREIISELKMHDIVFSTEYRIEVRRKLNERLGIYS